MQSAIAEAASTRPKPANGNYLTSDGVHMALAGNLVMAAGVLKGFGLDAAELAKAKDAWLAIPNVGSVAARMDLNLRQVIQIEKLAARKKVTVDALVNDEFRKVVESLLEAADR
jgi:hypothetical protein